MKEHYAVYYVSLYDNIMFGIMKASMITSTPLLLLGLLMLFVNSSIFCVKLCNPLLRPSTFNMA